MTLASYGYGRVEKVPSFKTDPYLFTENLGQLADAEGRPLQEAYFSFEAPGVRGYVTRWGLTLFFYRIEQHTLEEEEEELESTAQMKRDSSEVKWERVDVELVGACVDRERIRKGLASPWGRNYYLGHYPQGVLGVRGYGEVRIEGVWPGVDWVLRYDERVGGVKQEFVVQGGYRWDVVRLRIWSKGRVEVGGGRLRVMTAYGEFVEEGLVGYYGSERVGLRYRVIGERREGEVRVVEVGYEVVGVPEVVGRTLVIDPVLQWGTYFGGGNHDWAYSVAVDGSGNVYVVGFTRSSSGFPLQNPGGGAYYDDSHNGGISDAFIARFSGSNLGLVWSTYFGGGEDDWAYSVAVDGSGNVYVVGRTLSSSGFPLQNPGGGAYYDNTHNGGDDIFIAKFSGATLGLVWSTYFGGSGGDYTFTDRAIVASDGFVAVAGVSSSIGGIVDIPNTPFCSGSFQQGNHGESWDLLILTFELNGAIRWRTFYGGPGYEGDRASVAVYSPYLYVVGNSNGSLPATHLPNPGGGAYHDNSYNGGFYDAVLLRFDYANCPLFYGDSEKHEGDGKSNVGVSWRAWWDGEGIRVAGVETPGWYSVMSVDGRMVGRWYISSSEGRLEGAWRPGLYVVFEERSGESRRVVVGP